MKQTLTILLLIFIFAACTPPEQEKFTVNKGILVLNEGVFGNNNASITYYDEENDSIFQNAFLAVNGRQLGELANDMQIYGSKIYILMGGSNTIEITDLHLKSIKQIKFSDNIGKEPHSIAFANGKAYITCYNNYLTVLDTNNLLITNNIPVWKNPEGIAIANNKAYIACGAGMDYPNFDSIVTVVDLSNFQTSKIVVNMNPFTIDKDPLGNIYVLCCGNYGGDTMHTPVDYSFVKIDANNHIVTQYPNITAADFVIHDFSAYLFGLNYNDYHIDYKIFNLNTGSIINENFVTDENLTLLSPRVLKYDARYRRILLGDTKFYTSNGRIYIIDENTGACLKNFETGISPKKIVTL
ncbi:MAG: hypothetical protein LBC89_02700 [Bacteroidales bacterium]|jgi:DNA-binding beta-propeller fold protein YncE|nr:hypothetical protein [Bacteroidales bacterium]